MDGGDGVIKTYPGMTVETTKLTKGASRQLFDGLFAAGGITLSQLCGLTGLEPYVIQNWVKRRFVSPPVGRSYGREQLAVVVLINLLKDALQIERICGLVDAVRGVPGDKSDDLCCFEALYHGYVDLLSEGFPDAQKEEAIKEAATRASAQLLPADNAARRKLASVYEVILYAHVSTVYRRKAEARLFHMDL